MNHAAAMRRSSAGSVGVQVVLEQGAHRGRMPPPAALRPGRYAPAAPARRSGGYGEHTDCGIWSFSCIRDLRLPVSRAGERALRAKKDGSAARNAAKPPPRASAGMPRNMKAGNRSLDFWKTSLVLRECGASSPQTPFRPPIGSSTTTFRPLRMRDLPMTQSERQAHSQSFDNLRRRIDADPDRRARA